MSDLAGWQWQRTSVRLAKGTAVAAGFLYLGQSCVFARSQASMLDEGAYLLSGYLFATRRYWPFQDFGPWTNQMPLSFLIPGVIQALTGPGLRTGRYFAILLGILLMISIWITVRRFAGYWWAAGALLSLAVNPALIKIYSLAISQVLVACMLGWMLVFILGKGRPQWQLTLGGLIAGMLPLTRLNLLPVLPLALGYVYWEHGRRKGFITSLVALGVFLVGHAFFWPGILRMWAEWLPERLVPFLSPWRPPKATPVWNPEVAFRSRVLSFLTGVRFHFLAFAGTVGSFLLWPKRMKWVDESRFRTVVFLGGVFVLLVAVHAWASLGVNPQTFDILGKNYCIFCFPMYLSFFSFIGVIILAITFSLWTTRTPALISLLVALFILPMGALLGYSAFDPVGDILLSLKIPYPRLFNFMRSGDLLIDRLSLLRLVKKYGLTYAQARRYFPTGLGFLAGIGVIWAAMVIVFIHYIRNRNWNLSFGYAAIIVILVTGWLLTPSQALGGGFHTYDCSGDVIRSYEIAGQYLADRIPPGSQVYWEGGASPAPLLYLQPIEIFPPQINGIYTFRVGGNQRELLAYGLWNAEIANDWLRRTDFVLVSENIYNERMRSLLLEMGKYRLLGQTPRLGDCAPKSRIYIFENTRP